ncbi:unnamed protein product (mitochondrion) [Plasmodiophora brassicae]|uniref:GYF domain-containing protein n=1 Tax=Plasmodiophora brassicae TaxID=37360 RepID=A0A0G4IIN2_PLABS|nr:hypothetical protein PBRA_003783 [Plasmodiophora brassicae]SPQ94301.1 unnamed protein product [Plasmodiophora brassicae]
MGGAARPEERDWQWYYVDDDGQCQGPHTHDDMADWFAVGWLRPDLLVRPSQRTVFKPLNALKPVPEFCRPQQRKPPPARSPPPPPPAPEPVETPEWMYLDENGEEQGPFPMAMMGAWFVSGHFDENVMVRPMNEQGFQLLRIHADAFRRAAAEVVPQMKHEFHVDDQRLDDEREEDTSDGQEVALWMYLDDSGEKQGPFTGTQMLTWYNAGFLDGSVRVRRKASPDETFFPIGDDAEALFTATVEEGLEETEKPSDEAAAVVRDGPDTKWFYIDDLGIEQGPYPAAHMRSWYDRGFLKPAVRIRTSDETEYTVFGNRVPCPQFAAHRPPPPVVVAPPVMVPSESWYYIDAEGHEQGPFATASMLAWKRQALLPPDLRVRCAVSGFYQPIESVDAFNDRPVANEDLVQFGGFQSHGRRFRASAASHWQDKDLPDDSAGRQMGHYFDVNAWQEQRNQQMAAQLQKKKKKR